MPKISYLQIEQYISKPRLSRYLKATNKNKTKAILLYKNNLIVSRSFYPLLSIFEITFRNSLNKVLELHFQDNDWIINQQNGFMSNSSLKQSKYYLKGKVKTTIDNLKRNNIHISSGKIIAEQTLGFWTSFFKSHHFALIKGKALYTFPNCPKGFKRDDIYRKLKKINDFRNRIYHYEPICFSGNKIDFSQVIEIHEIILEVLSWIDKNLLNFVKDLDNVLDEINRAKNI
jgi:hypothetical protein